MLLWILFLITAQAKPVDFHKRYLSWVRNYPITESLEPNYLFYSEIHHQIKDLVEEYPGRITPVRIGHTVNNRPIWAFRIRDPMTEIKSQVLVFAGLHALEWIGSEAAVATIKKVTRHPIEFVEMVVIPVVNVDRRLIVEADFIRGEMRYRRSNAANVDLNRDFEIHRTSKAIWKYMVPNYYKTSPAPLSQPESRALDRLAARENFELAISLHSFGGYIFFPWAGSYDKPKDYDEFMRLGTIMEQAQGYYPYRLQQLSHFVFFFRALGSEIDHLYGKYGIKSFLIELTRSGIDPFDRKSRKNPFRWYNPKDPKLDINRGLAAILTVSRHLGQQHW